MGRAIKTSTYIAQGRSFNATNTNKTHSIKSDFVFVGPPAPEPFVGPPTPSYLHKDANENSIQVDFNPYKNTKTIVKVGIDPKASKLGLSDQTQADLQRYRDKKGEQVTRLPSDQEKKNLETEKEFSQDPARLRAIEERLKFLEENPFYVPGPATQSGNTAKDKGMVTEINLPEINLSGLGQGSWRFPDLSGSFDKAQKITRNILIALGIIGTIVLIK